MSGSVSVALARGSGAVASVTWTYWGLATCAGGPDALMLLTWITSESSKMEVEGRVTHRPKSVETLVYV